MSIPKILVAYASTHGQTQSIASRIQQSLERRGIQVTLANLKEGPAPALDQFDGVVVGASVIARGHQPAVADFIRERRDALNAMPTAFFSVSASAGSSLEKGRAAARRVRDTFLVETGFRPALTECVAGAISTDTSRDHEYTDWHQVEAFAHKFAMLILKRAPAVPDDAPVQTQGFT